MDIKVIFLAREYEMRFECAAALYSVHNEEYHMGKRQCPLIPLSPKILKLLGADCDYNIAIHELDPYSAKIPHNRSCGIVESVWNVEGAFYYLLGNLAIT